MTKKILLLILYASALLGISGCREIQRGPSDPNNLHGGSFPAHLAGVWKTDQARWIFTLDSKGQISKMRHFVGMVIDVPEGGLTEEWKDGATATYFLGPCYTEYDPQTRQLSIIVNIDRYIIEFLNGTMEGSYRDHLVGPVSEDGLTWKPLWNSTSEIIGQAFDTIEPKQLTFTKVTDKEYQ